MFLAMRNSRWARSGAHFSRTRCGMFPNPVASVWHHQIQWLFWTKLLPAAKETIEDPLGAPAAGCGRGASTWRPLAKRAG